MTPPTSFDQPLNSGLLQGRSGVRAAGFEPATSGSGGRPGGGREGHQRAGKGMTKRMPRFTGPALCRQLPTLGCMKVAR